MDRFWGGKDGEVGARETIQVKEAMLREEQC